MKNLFFVFALSMGTMTAFAQDTESEVAIEVIESVEKTAITQDDFAEISTEELPDVVTTAVEKNYPTANIDKAYSNVSKQYKLEVSLQDGSTGTLFADEDGNWIEMY